MKRLNLIGHKYNRLKVVKSIGSKNGKSYWLCKCDCGNFTKATSVNLRQNSHKSCGCYQVDFPSFKRHGMSDTRFHNIWKGMKKRCFKESSGNYGRYGGRGITVCKRWLVFENFRDDMHKQYVNHVNKFGEKDTQIDRINVNGNYEPKNCRWVTIKEQASNKR